MTQEVKKVDTKALVVSEFNEFETKLAEFKEKYIDVVYDLDDADQEKQARSDRLAIGKVISKLDAKHKEVKAPFKVKIDLFDSERKRIKDDLLDVQGKIKSQIAEHERKIQEHAEMLQDKVEAIRGLTDFRPIVVGDSRVIAERLEQAKAHDVDDSYEHRKADATLAMVDAIKELEIMLADRVKYEEEQAELERLRKEAAEREQADREERIRAEAAEKAKTDSEKKAKEAAEAAERDRIKAEEAAQAEIQEAKRKQQEAEQAAEKAAQAERARIEEEQRQAEAKAEQARQAEEARKSKQKHRAKIHKAAKQSLIDNGIPEDVAGQVVTLIKDELIENIRVVY
jgi:hypothetical protein